MTSRAGDAAGFTLLELLVVLAIGGLLLSIAAPVVGRGFDSVSADAAVRYLVLDLRATRRAAIETRRDIALVLDLGRLEYSAAPDGRVRRLPPGVGLAAGTPKGSAGDKVEFRFFRDGSASGGWIALQGKTRGYRVDIEWLSGRISVHG